MPLNWSQLKEYKCPLPNCGGPLKEIKYRHNCTLCNFSISDQKLSNMVVIRHRKLEPPEFIKELRKENKESFVKKCIKLFTSL